MSDNYTAIIDYKMGNLRSVEKAFEKVGETAVISNDHETLTGASRLVLPGVGAFGDGMKNLEALGLIELLNDLVIDKNKPILGICLGMQLMGHVSYEMGKHKGLGWIEDTSIIKFDFEQSGKKLKIPHVGWNDISFEKGSKIFEDIPDHSDFYFVHSYHFKCPKEYITSRCEYGYDFVSSIEKDNIYACQFHPEKSQEYGLKILKNFASLESVC